MKKFWLFMAGAFLLNAVPATAATLSDPEQKTYNMPARAPFDPTSLPLLGDLAQRGAKLYYIGERSGLHGWFVIMNGHVQVIYVTADKKSAVIGALFAAGGENISGDQLRDLVDQNEEVKESISTLVKQQKGISGTISKERVDVAGGKDPKKAKDMTPGERLLSELEIAAGVVFGSDRAPAIHMVVEPGCSYCKETWDLFSKPLDDGKVRVHLILTAKKGSSEENDAAAIMGSPSPKAAWQAYLRGDKKNLKKTLSQVDLDLVAANRLVASRWDIRNFPFITYHAKDGSVKIVSGKPKELAAVLKDLP